MTKPPAPDDLGDSGLTLWTALVDAFDFDAEDLVVVTEAARVKDRLDALDLVVRAQGVTVESPQGLRAHPALIESRQQQIVLTRLVASLRLPIEDDDETDTRPQRRGGARGAYRSRAMGNR